MKKYALLVIGLAGVIYMASAWSQCSNGVDTGGECVPPEELGLPGYGNQQQAPESKIVWADRWGAFALDKRNGYTGASVEKENKSIASQDAITQCIQKGGKDCEIILAFHNQCGAVAQIKGGGGVSTASAPTIKM